MNSLENVSYIFIPFLYKKQTDFGALIDELDGSETWTLIHDEIVYMLKYVADKIDSRNRKNCQCFHFELNKEVREKMGLGPEEFWCSTSEHNFYESSERFRFQILSVQLYCFSTTVCIMAFKVHFEKNDPMWLSSAQYYVKKVSREKIYISESQKKSDTLLDISKRLVSNLQSVHEFDFFYYANPSTERANLLTYLEVEAKEDYKKELFYLRRCYRESFLYEENEELDRNEIYIPSKGTIWGISPEAAVCLVCPELGKEQFIRGKFYKNFNAQYLFMYVLLLHQKYVLYMLLTKIGVGTYNDLETLEEYRHQLYEFETDFVFSCVTEVPQYMYLYERMTQAFSLKKMYEDVHEPLRSLGEIRRIASEDKQKKRDNNVNKALLMLSVLSFFSALVDSFDFAEAFFGWFLSDTGVKVVQVLCIAIIVVVAIYVFWSLVHSKKD